MTTKLDPPAVPPLSPDQHARLRHQVMDQTQPQAQTQAQGRRASRWLVPAIAVGAVAAVVAATLVITHSPTTQPAVTTTTSPAVVDETNLPPSVDLGPVPAAEAAAKATVACLFGQAHTQPVEVLWARRMTGREAGSRAMMLLIRSRDLTGGNHAQGIEACYVGPADESSGDSVSDQQWSAEPTQQQGLLELSDALIMGHSPRYVHDWIVYRARPEIARIESRYVVGKLSGPWTRGIVADGYAVADSWLEATASNRLEELQNPMSGKVEVRAYDANGREVPINP